jgi:O-antigen/teichoic acid export membrane protein
VGVVGALYLRVDVLLLGWLADSAAVGRYFTAARVLEASYGLPHLLMLAMLPRLVRAAAFAPLFRRAALVFLGLGTAAAAALTVVAPWLLPRLYPEEGAAIAGLVVALAPAAIAVFLGFLATQSLAVLGRARTWLGLALAGLVLNLALDLALIPAYGALGAAWATVATELAVAVPAVVACLRAAAARSASAPAASSSATSC